MGGIQNLPDYKLFGSRQPKTQGILSCCCWYVLDISKKQKKLSHFGNLCDVCCFCEFLRFLTTWGLHNRYIVLDSRSLICAVFRGEQQIKRYDDSIKKPEWYSWQKGKFQKM